MYEAIGGTSVLWLAASRGPTRPAMFDILNNLAESDTFSGKCCASDFQEIMLMVDGTIWMTVKLLDAYFKYLVPHIYLRRSVALVWVRAHALLLGNQTNERVLCYTGNNVL